MLAEQQRVKIFFNIATQIAVYHLKYRVQSEEKGHKGHYALVPKDLSLFSFYSMPTNRLLEDKIGNSQLRSLEDCFILFPQPEEKKEGFTDEAQQLSGLLVPTGCPHPVTLCSLLRQLNFIFFFLTLS